MSSISMGKVKNGQCPKRIGGGLLGCGGFGRLPGLGFAVFTIEFFYTPGSVEKLLFSGVKRMAVGAYFNMHILHGGVSLNLMPTGTMDGDFEILRMNICFHKLPRATSSWSTRNRRWSWFPSFLPRGGPSYHGCPWGSKLFLATRPAGGLPEA